MRMRWPNCVESVPSAMLCASEEIETAAEEAGGVVDDAAAGGVGLGKAGHAALESVECACDLGRDAVGVGAEVVGREGLGAEGGVVGGGGEGEVHLGGAAAEEGGGVEIEPGVFACRLRGAGVRRGSCLGGRGLWAAGS